MQRVIPENPDTTRPRDSAPTPDAGQELTQTQATLATIAAAAVVETPSTWNGEMSARVLTTLLDLWERFDSRYGTAWRREYGASPVTSQGELTAAGRAWGEGLMGLTPQQVRNGVAAALNSPNEFPPNVARFRVLALGLPSLAEVELQLQPERERSPFVVLVWSMLDAHRYRTSDGREQVRLLRGAYDMAMKHVLERRPMPEAVPALPPSRPKPLRVVDRDQARSAMERAAEELGYAQGGSEA